MESETANVLPTPTLLHAARTAGFHPVLTLPCSVLTQWRGQEGQHDDAIVALSREEEGVGIAVGLTAAGSQPLLMIQNSGLGNCVNALASLAIAYEVPLVILVSMRGDELDDNPAQLPMGLATVPLIEALRCRMHWVRSEDEVANVLSRAKQQAKALSLPTFVLLPRKEALTWNGSKS